MDLSSYVYNPSNTLCPKPLYLWSHTISQNYMLMHMIHKLDSAFGRPHYYWLYIGCILLYKKESVVSD